MLQTNLNKEWRAASRGMPCHVMHREESTLHIHTYMHTYIHTYAEYILGFEIVELQTEYTLKESPGPPPPRT